jgi:hypothetical protein
MKRHLLLIGMMIYWNTGQAQMTSVEAIKKIAFIEGQWEGIANVTSGPGQNLELDQQENVELKLEGKLMAIEGKGFNKGKLEFNAFAIVTFNEENQEYEMQSWLSTGQKTKAYIILHEENHWEWGFDIPQGKVRYFIMLNDKGQWSEKGEFSPNGSVWYPSFNMLLTKKQ